MPRVKCPKCNRDETVLRSGFVRGLQRYVCKFCNFHFTLVKKRQKNNASAFRKHQTTILDIAKAVGMSASTVSRALTNHGDISEATKSLIKQVSIEMDYQPNPLARSLYSRETQTIGIIIPDLENPFFAKVLSGIQHAASTAGYKVMICQSNESHKTEVANLQTMMQNWLDGILVCHTKETKSFEHIKLQLNKGIPIIHFDRICEEIDTSRVLLDNENGAEQITDHLIDQGCLNIAVLAGPKHLYITKKRLEGYFKSLQKNNIPTTPSLIAYTDFTKVSILQTVDLWLSSENPPDAIFCISDNSAIITMMYLKKKNIKVPQEICVAGFGNDYTGEIIEPALTSYDPYAFKIGQTAVELFFDQVISGDRAATKTKTVIGKLLIRDSSLRKK
ncbi:LacI family DNA-binding transcriptional regulator [Sphingobacterium arenae]|uniref:LacI family DNA-binding transcriptional regulator n=1 Tax=Sphingobacterium arenae TaxID=1280598 RepID=A0ABR7Y3B0_9SPHI|nr:substrate-binding domain-containing protein [Sphingobacterium arenae]MBD1425746.1 LacI family DNA-binding transcriptional regulator [Sphingobacterium arenae]